MFVLIESASTEGGITSALMEAGVLTSLELRAPSSVPDAALAEYVAMHWAGRVADGHAWLSIDLLRQHGAGDDPQWLGKFDSMIDFAASKGWVSSDRRLVRAHIVALP